jgi:hypothetical protein
VADAEVDGGVGGIDGVLDEGHACFSCGCRLDSLRRYAGLDAGCEGWDADFRGPSESERADHGFTRIQRILRRGNGKDFGMDEVR